MNLRFSLFLNTLLIFFSCSNMWAQSEIFTGRLIDSETGQPIANSNISIVDNEVVHYSNSLGYFQISGVNKTVLVSHVGYKTVKAKLSVEAPNFLMRLSPERYL